MLFRAHMGEKVKKFGWILENSGNFLSNEHNTVFILFKNCWETWIQRYLLPAKRKKAKIWATSHKLFICFQDCMDFKKSPETFSGIFYQMDHIWWAPSRLKKSPGLKMKSQWSDTLYRSLITTLYIYFMIC